MIPQTLYRRERLDLIVGFRIHQEAVLSLRVEVLHGSSLDASLLHPLTGAEGLVNDCARTHVPKPCAHKGSPLAGLYMLKLDNGEDLVILNDGEPVAEIASINHSAEEPPNS